MPEIPIIGDNAIGQLIPVAGIPLDVNTYLLTSSSVATSSILTFTITNTTAQQYLSLWNYLITVHVDTDDAAHAWPNGGSLSAAQLSLRLQTWMDYDSSNDKTNKRIMKITIENFSGSTRTYYLHFKAYTFAIVTGSAA